MIANKLIIIVVCLVLVLILGLFLGWPKYQGVQALRLNIKAKEMELQSKEEYFSQIKEISEELEKYTESLSKISSALPETPALPSLLNFLQLTASQTGLVLEKVILGGVGGGEIRVTCQMAGNYPAFKNFLVALENSARMIEVEEISFKSPEKAGESFSFSVQIKTHSY